MFKKAAMLSSLNTFQIPTCPSAISTTSPLILPQPRARPINREQRRQYANHRSDTDISWPTTATGITPTPYEIFDLKRGEPYSKRNFYILVKLYHPDRHGQADTHCGGISYSTKLERYRLVILAHEILSDPTKRREYDSNGVGWVERNERWARYNPRDHGRSGPFGYGAGYDASPFANATWEDWERWREKSGESSQTYEGNYVSQNGFAGIVILLAVISGFAQATRAGQYSTNLEAKIKSVNEETQSFMQTRAGDSSDLRHDGRVKLFLEKRDSRKLGLQDGEEETYGKAFEGQLALPRPSIDEEEG